jgi:hypothetical protein
MGTVKWFVGAPRRLSFIIGALAIDDLVYLDYLAPSDVVDEVVHPITATIDVRSTGACHVDFTPVEYGTYRFWPRITDAGGTVKNIGEARLRIVDKPGF